MFYPDMTLSDPHFPHQPFSTDKHTNAHAVHKLNDEIRYVEFCFQSQMDADF